MKIKFISLSTILCLHFSSNLFSQQSILIDAGVTYQTINGFGASDAWNCDIVGNYWSLTEKEKIAKYLFSKEVDIIGNPLGIGLSRWRFNIGAGSFELGNSSRISKPERRAECFMNSFNLGTNTITYDWNKQIGQQWFLNQAKNYGVESLLAFCNSPPYFFTNNNQTNMDSDNLYANTNLKSIHYDEFSKFIGEVITHFSNSGINFNQISPINEPQFGWYGGGSEGQEGCPYKNEEATQLIKAINQEFQSKGISTKIFIGEAARWDYLNEINTDGKDPDKLDQIRDFFDNSRASTYIGNLPSLLQGISAHSYWINTKNDANIKSYRENVSTLANIYNIELYQSEFNLLGDNDHYNDYWLNSLYLCKIIQADLIYANVASWDFWTAIERERWDQKNRFYLLPLKNTAQGSSVHNYTDLDQSGGYVGTDKNLWAFGNFSRFIRPNYKRIQLSGADNLSDLIGSAYISNDNKEIVMVYVNWSNSSKTIAHTFNNLPSNQIVEHITPYITDSGLNNLTKKNSFTSGDFTLPSQSVSTFVVKLKEDISLSIDFSNHETTASPSKNSTISIFPNPAKNNFKIECSETPTSIEIFDFLGNSISTIIPIANIVDVECTNFKGGIYFVKIVTDKKIQFIKLLKH